MNLKGIKANFLGDSITECCGAKKAYHQVLKEICGLAEARNYGKGGTRIARQSEIKEPNPKDEDFIMRAQTMNDDADLIVVFGGTNDYGNGQAPLGELSDTSIFTFYGAVHTLCEDLKKKYPNAKIVFMTPLHRWNECGGLGTWKPDGVVQHHLCDYVKAIKEACAMHAVPVLDLFNDEDLPINDNDFRREYAPDGLHPNDAGHEILAHKLKEFLEKL